MDSQRLEYQKDVKWTTLWILPAARCGVRRNGCRTRRRVDRLGKAPTHMGRVSMPKLVKTMLTDRTVGE